MDELAEWAERGIRAHRAVDELTEWARAHVPETPEGILHFIYADNWDAAASLLNGMDDEGRAELKENLIDMLALVHTGKRP